MDPRKNSSLQGERVGRAVTRRHPARRGEEFEAAQGRWVDWIPSFSTRNPGCKDLQQALDPGREVRDPGSEVEDPGRESVEGDEVLGRWVDRGGIRQG